MFIGHFGAGFGAKRIDAKPSLGTLFLAAQFIDLLWPVFLLLGVENVTVVPGNTAFNPLEFTYYPFSHSLFFVLIWALVFGGGYYLFKKSLKTSLVLGALVLSHWFLDLIVHVPDLPLFPWNDFKLGLGLWNSVPFTILLEGGIFIFGFYLYAASTKAKNKKGIIGLWSLIFFLAFIYVMNLFSSPPPSGDAIGIVGLSQWLLIIWGYWVGRNRENIIVEDLGKVPSTIKT